MVSKTSDQVRRNMRAIRGSNTKIELLLRLELWSRGYRYRKNVSNIFGKPDIAFLSKKVAIFCDSEFWHGQDWEVRKNDIKSNREFWINKIEKNIQRDIEVNNQLANDGWVVLRFSGKDILKNVSGCADIVERIIKDESKI